ncbi:MAG: BatD family protein, partial [Cyclobacteriaceae bacterium]|nr:BatD family protein [Cyclobacteriaceae bacterium]
GNLAGLEKPVIPPTDSVDVYEPNIRQNISRDRGRVTGTKSFSYFLIPKEPGNIALKNYFSWVFFNPVTVRYDTLKSNAMLYVTGESMATGMPQETDADDFYSATATASNNLQTHNSTPWAEYVLYSLAILLVAASIFIYAKKTV